MASKKYLELQEFSDAELASELHEIETQSQKLRFDHAIKGLDNPLRLKEIRRDVARLKSEIRRRELAKMDEAQIAGRSKIRARRKRTS
ncbi:MAG: 50S ribosomal protein L29 [Saprospiraceae bacterium]